jgi:D-glycero-D-manno-heptose 1,7-bisphosphate phosphatase
MSKKALFLDRDGVINVSPGDGYVLSWAQFKFSPGILPALKVAHDRGYQLIVVTSQQGVGKGLMSMAELNAIHAEMIEIAAQAGIAFAAIESCTHLAGTCTCRKPSPEMITRSAAHLGIDVGQSWMIGDHDRDIQMAINAGVPHTIRVLSHHAPTVAATHTVERTDELAALLRRVLT